MTKNLSFTPYSLFLFFSGGLYNEVALTSLWLNAHPIIIFQAHVFVLKVAMGSLVQPQNLKWNTFHWIFVHPESFKILWVLCYY